MGPAFILLDCAARSNIGVLWTDSTGIVTVRTEIEWLAVVVSERSRLLLYRITTATSPRQLSYKDNDESTAKNDAHRLPTVKRFESAGVSPFRSRGGRFFRDDLLVPTHRSDVRKQLNTDDHMV